MLQPNLLINYQQKLFHYCIMHVQPFFPNSVLEYAWITKFKYTEFLCLLPFLRVYFADVQTLQTYLGAHTEKNYS